MGKQRRRPRTGRGVLTIRRTKGGSRVIARLDGIMYPTWLACYQSALAGMIAAQRRTPNPAMVARWCATMADVAAIEATYRRSA